MLIEFAKLIFQKDARDSIKELLALIKKNPEWKRDLVTLDEKFKDSDAARIQILTKFIRELLVQKGWHTKRAGIVEFAIQELSDNSCTHGTPIDGSEGVMCIRAVVSGEWVSCEVTDSGPGFDLAKALQAQATGEAHGLLRVSALAARLSQLSPNAVAVTIVRQPALIELRDSGEVTSISLHGRLDAEALNGNPEFLTIDSRLPEGARFIVDLTDATYVSSTGLRLLTQLEKSNRLRNRQAVLLVTPDSAISELLLISKFDKLYRIVFDKEEALQSLKEAK